MRDIRNDLHERLHAAEQQRSSLETQLQTAVAYEKSLRDLLTEEEARFSKQHQLFSKGNVGKTPISKFLMERLERGGNWRLGELKEEALKAGIDFENKNPGRVLHFALLGMAQNGIVQQYAKGIWRLRGLS